MDPNFSNGSSRSNIQNQFSLTSLQSKFKHLSFWCHLSGLSRTFSYLPGFLFHLFKRKGEACRVSSPDFTDSNIHQCQTACFLQNDSAAYGSTLLSICTVCDCKYVLYAVQSSLLQFGSIHFTKHRCNRLIVIRISKQIYNSLCFMFLILILLLKPDWKSTSTQTYMQMFKGIVWVLWSGVVWGTYP